MSAMEAQVTLRPPRTEPLTPRPLPPQMAAQERARVQAASQRRITLAILEAYYVGLEIIEFPMEELPEDPSDLVVDWSTGRIEISTRVWNLLNNDEKFHPQQYKVIYGVLRRVQSELVLRAIRLDEGSLGLLTGEEHKAQPLELTGEQYVRSLLKDLQRLLHELGLDRGFCQDKIGGSIHPEVIKFYQKQRDDLFRVYRLYDWAELFRFVARSSEYLTGWPEEISHIFNNDWELTLKAVERVREANGLR